MFSMVQSEKLICNTKRQEIFQLLYSNSSCCEGVSIKQLVSSVMNKVGSIMGHRCLCPDELYWYYPDKLQQKSIRNMISCEKGNEEIIAITSTNYLGIYRQNGKTVWTNLIQEPCELMLNTSILLTTKRNECTIAFS
jgi:hypothetical protein